MTSSDNSVVPAVSNRMLGSFATTLLSAQQTLILMRYRRVLWFGPLGICIIGAFALLIAAQASDSTSGFTLFCLIAWWGLSSFVMPWVTLYLGVQSVHGEIEDRTSQYLFLRPVHRVWILVGKWIAVSLVSVVFAIASVTATFVGVSTNTALWPDGADSELLYSFAIILSLGSMAYAAVAVFFGAMFRRPLLWAAIFVVGVQMLVANLPISAGIRQLTIADPMRCMVLDMVEPDGRLARQLWPAERSEALRIESASDAMRLEFGSPLSDLLILTAVCLALAAVRYASTEYESRKRD